MEEYLKGHISPEDWEFLQHMVKLQDEFAETDIKPFEFTEENVIRWKKIGCIFQRRNVEHMMELVSNKK